MEKRSKATPIYMLSGFLGSGKTTLLQRLLTYWKERGLRPAVVMNELGEVNLDGVMVGEEVPMTEMLGGCICCSIRSDLSAQLYELIREEQPDLVVIEATGAANPLEMFDAVTESSLYLELDIRPMITVVDAAHLAELYAKQQGKTYRLMLEQIRCGSDLILNKIDRIGPAQQQEMRELLERLNPYARIIPAVRCEVAPVYLLGDGKRAETGNPAMGMAERKRESLHAGDDGTGHDSADGSHSHHHSHDHVTVYTHYFSGPVDSVEFENFISELPREIYRGKGVLSFSDTASRFLFQYAYREADYLKITPQGEVPDVVVFIGEHFDKTKLAETLSALEERTEQA